MRYSFLLLLIAFLSCIWVNAQKIGYIDSEFILSKMPEYKKAEDDLNKISLKWQKEVEDKYKDLEKLKTDFNNTELLLTEDIRKEKLDTISKREKNVKDLQNKYFGYEGMLFFKRQELSKPVQDKLFLAVQKVSRAKQIQIMFDKSADIVMIYTDPKHDYTDYVLEELGLGDKRDTIDNKPNDK